MRPVRREGEHCAGVRAFRGACTKLPHSRSLWLQLDLGMRKVSVYQFITMKTVLLVLATSSLLATCHPPPHPAVVAVRREEELLPPYLRSPALRNPHLRELLPLTSVLHRGENLVFDREADHVDRQEIYNILTHAGFVPRRPQHLQPSPFHQAHQRTNKHRNSHPHNSFDHQLQHHNFPSELLSNPEFLQHL